MLIAMQNDAVPVDDVEATLNDVRLGRGLRWDEIADSAGISVPTLLRFRKGKQRTPETAAKIERALGFPRGHLAAIVAGEAPPGADSTGPQESQRPPTALAELEQMQAIIAELLKQALDLQRRLDDEIARSAQRSWRQAQ